MRRLYVNAACSEVSAAFVWFRKAVATRGFYFGRTVIGKERPNPPQQCALKKARAS
jgi:hypothetical protein